MKPKQFQGKTISLLIAAVAGAFLCSTTAITARGPQWFVWEKVSPCQDTRQDWFTVADRYPGESVSTNAWQQADGPFATFAAAMAAADTAKMSPTIPNFKRRCCNDWAVFMRIDQQGNKTFSAGRIAPDAPNPPAFQGFTVLTGGLCCEEAFNMAFGSTVGQFRDCRNLQLSTGATVTLTANGTFVPFGGGGGGMRMTTENNINRPGQDYRNFDLSQPSPDLCRDACAKDPNCKAYTYVKPGLQGANARCWLKSGVPPSTPNSCCVSGLKSVSAGGFQRGGSGSNTGQGGSGGAGGTANPGGGPNSGQRPCNADEAAAFAKMTGSFKSYRMNITIGGSCEQASGTFKVTEWCEGVDETYNAATARVVGTFTGRMSGGSLQLSWDQPAHTKYPASNGTGYCSLNSDGSFRCSGFGCPSTFKKQ